MKTEWTVAALVGAVGLGWAAMQVGAPEREASVAGGSGVLQEVSRFWPAASAAQPVDAARVNAPAAAASGVASSSLALLRQAQKQDDLMNGRDNLRSAPAQKPSLEQPTKQALAAAPSFTTAQAAAQAPRPRYHVYGRVSRSQIMGRAAGPVRNAGAGGQEGDAVVGNDMAEDFIAEDAGSQAMLAAKGDEVVTNRVQSKQTEGVGINEIEMQAESTLAKGRNALRRYRGLALHQNQQ